MPKFEVNVTNVQHGTIIVEADSGDDKSIEKATEEYLMDNIGDASGYSGVTVVEEEGWMINSEGWSRVTD